jgi:hypothetical protein
VLIAQRPTRVARKSLAGENGKQNNRMSGIADRQSECPPLPMTLNTWLEHLARIYPVSQKQN